MMILKSNLKMFHILTLLIHQDSKNIEFTSDYNIYFSVKNPKNIDASYMIIYYYTEYFEEYEYYFNEKFERKHISSNDENINISLTFNSMKIKTGINRDQEIRRKGIYFLITGTLYKRDIDSNESINTTSKLTEHIPFFKNSTTYYYNQSRFENWNLIYENIPRDNS